MTAILWGCFIFTAPLLQAEDNFEVKDVQVGDWVITPTGFSVGYLGSTWSGEAHRSNGDSISLDIYLGKKKNLDLDFQEFFEIEGLGTISFGMEISSDTLSMEIQAQMWMPREQEEIPLYLKRTFLYEGKGQFIILTSQSPLQETTVKLKSYTNMSAEQRKEFEEKHKIVEIELLKKISNEIENEPAIQLLEEMIKKQVELGQYIMIKDPPRLVHHHGLNFGYN